MQTMVIAERTQKVRLILLCFLMFFVELVIIRWSQSNILYLSYFSNFVLLGSFLGIGIGFMYANVRVNFFYWSPILLLCYIIFITQFSVHIELPRNQLFNQLLIFSDYHVAGLPPWLTLPIVFLTVSVVMGSIAHGVASVFKQISPLQAYRLDIIGSLSGIVCFTLLSFLHSSPFVWILMICVIYIALFILESSSWNIPKMIQLLALALLLAFATGESAQTNIFWSPYSKIKEITSVDKKAYQITSNGIPYQTMQSYESRFKSEPFYWYPYLHLTKIPEKLLIIGAGSGSDVGVALRHGVKNIDAVEIDPIIYRLGKIHHPDRPYQNKNVHVYIDDGRSFLQKSREKYDMIIFALPDSHVLLSGQSSLRLESFLLTQEAMIAAKKHLKENGVFVAYNYYREEWVVDRLANTLLNVYQHSPCVDSYGEGRNKVSILAISAGLKNLQCTSTWQPANHQYAVPATDDHPFFYLKEKKIPFHYMITLGLIMLASICLLAFYKKSISLFKSNLDFFFLGIAFFLLEAKSIAAFSLLFGSTWLVNAFVFIGILLSVYAAIEVTRYAKQINSSILYAGLIIFLLMGWMIPLQQLLYLSFPLRWITAVLLTFSPIFFANLIFAKQFQHSQHSTFSFGVNLVGAVIGGVLEYSSMLIGFRNLLIIIGILYALTFLFNMRQSKILFKTS